MKENITAAKAATAKVVKPEAQVSKPSSRWHVKSLLLHALHVIVLGIALIVHPVHESNSGGSAVLSLADDFQLSRFKPRDTSVCYKCGLLVML